MSFAVHVADPTSLPGKDAFRCAAWTRRQGVDPVGSAGTFDAFLLVETPLPWPKDVAEVPALARVAGASPLVRVQAVVPDPDRARGSTGVTVWHRVGFHRFEGVDHEVATPDLPVVLQTLMGDPTASISTVVAASPRELLICTHGKRDGCCGRFGTLLHAEVAARWADVRVRRCSHTGGHRYAPTGFTFPEGRAWAFLDAEILDAAVRQSGAVGDLHDHQRGTTSVDAWGQVVERALFEEIGWQWLDCEITSVHSEPAGDGSVVTVDWTSPDGESWRAVGKVAVARVVPVLICGEPPERATKSSPELTLTSLDIKHWAGASESRH